MNFWINGHCHFGKLSKLNHRFITVTVTLVQDDRCSKFEKKQPHFYFGTHYIFIELPVKYTVQAENIRSAEKWLNSDFIP